MGKIYSNIVTENIVRKKQLDTLEIIADSVRNSFGPMGSHTAIIHPIGNNGGFELEYTKDGHSIVNALRFKDPIEISVQDLVTELTRYIVKEVGDGTSSAAILSKNVFEHLYRSNNLVNNAPADTIKKFNDIIDEVNERILNKGRECTVDDIYNIALISTNGNEEIAEILKNIYNKYGMNVFIDVGISISVDTLIKEYDGMTLDTGIADMCFVNNHNKNNCSIRNPKIYAFNDAIDTPEMLSMLDAILEINILRAYRPNSVCEPTPTVILCKNLSPDTSSYFATICQMLNAPGGDNIPLLIVSDIHQEDLYEDLVKMCGAPLIKKYLNPAIQKEDIDKGLAPTLETIADFCGSAELVVSDQYKTKVINPSKMLNEDGSYSDDYKAVLGYLEKELTKAENENAGINVTGKLKRRINSFKGNMIDLLVGGVTTSDRNNLKASVEDAVLNCRSAAKYGVGYGANFMAYSILYDMVNEDKYIGNEIVSILFNAYKELCVTLYHSQYQEEAEHIAENTLLKNMPLNIRTNQYDGKVLSSIKSDIAILDTIAKILTLMFTCNQYLVQSPVHNIYITEMEELDK